MNVTAKFYVAAVNPGGTAEEPSADITLRAVTNETPENKTWSKYTPSGTLEMNVTNPEAIEQFKQGEEVFVTITSAKLSEPAQEGGSNA